MAGGEGGDSFDGDDELPVVPYAFDVPLEPLEYSFGHPHAVALVVLPFVLAEIFKATVLEVAEGDEAFHLLVGDGEPAAFGAVVVRGDVSREARARTGKGFGGAADKEQRLDELLPGIFDLPSGISFNGVHWYEIPDPGFVKPGCQRCHPVEMHLQRIPVLSHFGYQFIFLQFPLFPLFPLPPISRFPACSTLRA